MYLRFVTLAQDEHSRKKQGLFISTYSLKEEGEFDGYELETVERIFDWFNYYLKSPSFLKETGNNRCIAWFKPEVRVPLRYMWELYYLLQSKGVAVELLKARDVGHVRYEDEWQIIAQPYRHNRKRKF